MNKVEIQKLVGGALQEQFEKSFEKVIENLMNPNTAFKPPREISIKLKFHQNENRDDVKCEIQVSEKLAPQQPMATSFAIGKDLRTGKMYAKEYGKNVDQIPIDLGTPETVTVNTETGEILDNANNEAPDGSGVVINFKERKSAMC